MAWNSFLKNLIGGESSDTGLMENLENNSAARNENLSGRAFKKQLNETEKAVLLDVRTASEFSGGTIPGARNIDFLSPAFGKKVEQMDKEATYCSSGLHTTYWLKICTAML
ncbi:MAG: rhodanese-like domain-containing protein [Saprospiraceae bacterium]